MRNTGLDEAQAGIKIAGRNINGLRYADDTTLMAESEEELKSLLMKVKSESEVAQSCLTLSDLMDCSLPGSSVHGIFQARVQEWGAIAFSELLLADLNTDFSRGRSGGLVFPSLSEFSTVYCDPHSQRLWHSQ